VYSLPETNVAGYAMTRTKRAGTAQEAISLLADASIDLRKIAVLTNAEEIPALVPASRSVLVVERGGYRIEADSPGTSLLVLPVEYSHCLRADLATTGANPPLLMPANLTMATVLYSAGVDGTLLFPYGRLSRRCRIEDCRDANTPHSGEAREWPMARSDQ